jgi:creatinine amidohydrolase
MPETEHDLWTMTWEDAGEAFETADAVVLPTGSLEQHSTHLPLSVDSLRAEHLTAELVERAAEFDLSLLRLPTLPYGYSEHHMNYPGTATLSQETYRRVAIEIGESMAEHGVDRLVFVNFHGGNVQSLKLAADHLARELGMAAHFVNWTDFIREQLVEAFGDDWGHAGDHETSVIEHYRPDLVRSERKEPQTTREGAETRSFAYFEDLTEQGGLGDPTNSDPELLADLIDDGTEAILTALRSDIDDGW